MTNHVFETGDSILSAVICHLITDGEYDDYSDEVWEASIETCRKLRSDAYRDSSWKEDFSYLKERASGEETGQPEELHSAGSVA